MSRNARIYLEDIAECCAKILRYIEGMAQRELIGDEKTYDARVRNLEVIGEAAKQIPENIREQLPQIEWKKMSGMRDMLIHAYFGIDNDILWDVLQNKIPEIARTIRFYLDKNHRL